MDISVNQTNSDINKKPTLLRAATTGAALSGATSVGFIAGDKYCPTLTRKIVYLSLFSKPPESKAESILKKVSLKNKTLGVAALSLIGAGISAISSCFKKSN